GDYFEPRHKKGGYVAWMDYRTGRAAAPDPSYNYYRRHPAWSKAWNSLRGLYEARYRGDAPRPPHTLVEQKRLVQNSANRNVPNPQHVTVLAPITQIRDTPVASPASLSRVIKLEPVSPEEQA